MEISGKDGICLCIISGQISADHTFLLPWLKISTPPQRPMPTGKAIWPYSSNPNSRVLILTDQHQPIPRHPSKTTPIHHTTANQHIKTSINAFPLVKTTPPLSHKQPIGEIMQTPIALTPALSVHPKECRPVALNFITLNESACLGGGTQYGSWRRRRARVFSAPAAVWPTLRRKFFLPLFCSSEAALNALPPI